MDFQFYVYRAVVIRIVDGDTIDVRLDQGLHTYREERLRLDGLNAPELHDHEKSDACIAFVRAWLTDRPSPLVVQTIKDKDEKFGRLLARVWRAGDDKTLNDAMLDAGVAVPYSGGKR